jgi:hypothetical protein
MSAISELRGLLSRHDPIPLENAVAMALLIIEKQDTQIEELRAELGQYKERADERHRRLVGRIEALSGVHGAK